MNIRRLDVSKLVACRDCDLVFEQVDVRPGYALFCPRCGNRLSSSKRDPVDRTFAFSITGLLLYMPAISMPLMTLDLLGQNKTGSLIDGVIQLYRSGYILVSIVVLMTSILFPLVKLLSLFLVSLCLKLRRYPDILALLMRSYYHLDEWGMPEVYMIAILVTIVKIHHVAYINYDAGLFCFIFLLISALCCSESLDRELFWDLIEKGREGPFNFQGQTNDPIVIDNRGPVTAMELGIAVCPDCNRLVCVRGGTPPFCPRCGARIYLRKPNSMARTWALVLTAAILFFPANLLPIMRIDHFGIPSESTIMDGIIYFFKEGSYAIGIVILFASILVPLFKIIGIVLMLLSIHFRWKGWLRHKALMFRTIEFIGRWSMLDIFVVSILQVLVNFGYFTSIEVAPGATYFTGVVLTTMFAAIAFDPRLIWDQVSD